MRRAVASRDQGDFGGHASVTDGTRVGHAEHRPGKRALGPLRRGQLITGRGHVQLVQVGTAERGGRDLEGGKLDGRQQLAGAGIDLQYLRRGKRWLGKC